MILWLSYSTLLKHCLVQEEELASILVLSYSYLKMVFLSSYYCLTLTFSTSVWSKRRKSKIWQKSDKSVSFVSFLTHFLKLVMAFIGLWMLMNGLSITKMWQKSIKTPFLIDFCHSFASRCFTKMYKKCNKKSVLSHLCYNLMQNVSPNVQFIQQKCDKKLTKLFVLLQFWHILKTTFVRF